MWVHITLARGAGARFKFKVIFGAASRAFFRFRSSSFCFLAAMRFSSTPTGSTTCGLGTPSRIDSMSVGAGFGAFMYVARVSSMSAFDGRIGFGLSGRAITIDCSK